MTQGVPSGGRLRVYLVDDHPVVRSGLRTLVAAQADMEVVGEASDGITAVEEASVVKPDVIVMDLSLPKLGGAEATERIRAAVPSAKVLALTAHEERGYVQLLMNAGASGYLLKRTAGDDLVRAIRAVAAGGIYLDPEVASQVVVTGGQASERARARLSEREIEVLRLIAQGFAMKEIATTVGVSTRTLETYRARAMEKLGFKTRAEIVQYALRRGWLKAS